MTGTFRPRFRSRFRSRFVGPIGAGAGHLVLVFGLLRWSEYPIVLSDTVAVVQTITLIVGSFLVGFVPVLLFARTRLVAPIGMGIVGIGTASIAGFMTPNPVFARLGEHVLVEGPTYLGAYANGWYVWLLAYVFGGLCEYVVRTNPDGSTDTRGISHCDLPIDRRRSALIGCTVGLAHSAVFITLGLERRGAPLSGWLLAWGSLGTMTLGAIPVVVLLRYQLIGPATGLVAIVVVTGVETLTMTDSAPVSSYMLFWPVYLVLILLPAIGEYALRWGRRTVVAHQ